MCNTGTVEVVSIFIVYVLLHCVILSFANTGWHIYIMTSAVQRL